MKKKYVGWCVIVLMGILLVISSSSLWAVASERSPGWSTGFGGGAGWFLDGLELAGAGRIPARP